MMTINQAVIKPKTSVAQRKKYTAPQRPSIEELKKKYECPATLETPKTSNTSFEELKKKYESKAALETRKTPKPKSPKLLKKSKVKQMASLFNSRISQIVKRDSNVGQYSTLVNELSPEAKPQPKALSLPKPATIPKVRYTKEKAPVPSPRTKSKAKVQQNSICFVAEDVFAKLTVKDKAQLYTQFIEDMSKKNPNFVKHAELMEANVKKEVARGEVVNEKQESVKYLRDELEARCGFPKQTLSPLALQSKRISRRCKTIASTAVKSKEFEDIFEQKMSHISTLKVTLQPKPEVKKQRRAKSLPRRTTNADQLFKDMGIIEPSHKRNNDEMRSCLPIEAYAPPKKIRRTRAERLAPSVFFQNQQLEHLFFTWLKNRHDHNETTVVVLQETEIQEENPKSAIDKLLEEAIAKLETVETKQKEQLCVAEKDLDTASKSKLVERGKSLGTIAKVTPRKKKPAPAIPQSSNKPTPSSESSTTASAKHSENEENESGLSLLPKITSEESQTETHKKDIKNSEQELDYAKPLKPLRKKKMRRTLTWKKDSVLVESNTMASTDSETDCKVSKTKTKNKKLFIQPTTEENVAEVIVQPQPEPSFLELDATLMREVNSPRKIKSAYTLTIFSPPPPHNEEEDVNELETSEIINRETSRSWPSLIDNQIEKDLSMETKTNSSDLAEIQKKPEPRNLVDSFIDQGFETGSNEIESPARPPRRSALKRQDKVSSPLFIKLGSESRRVSIDPNCSIPENPSGFSTPIKGHLQQANHNSSPAQQQLFSPTTMPLKNRRKSLYDSESRRNSLAMQVIREGQPLEHHEIVSPRYLNTTEQEFFANAPTLDITTDMTGLNPNKTSQFWIKCGDFSVSLDIYYNDNERVRLLYEIFSQKSCDTKDFHFGIDNHKFAVHTTTDHENISKRLPANKDCSHYWFSTGDLAIPFIGKLLTSDKIQRLFQFIKAAVEETGILRFGVDEVEFSNVPEFWNQSPKFSMESSYSMLVGLQSGNSNGLEGRSKYAWPHSKPVRVSDLDQSDFECEDFDENESGRLSFSPFGSNYFDLASLDDDELSMPRNSEAMKSPESFYFDYENEPLDQLFDPKYNQEHAADLAVTPVTPMLATLKTQQERLSLVQEKISSYTKPANFSSDALDALKGTPEYILKLKSIVTDIRNIGCSTSFKDCTVEQLESYMFFLSRYADICLHTCTGHMEKVLDVLLDQRAVVV